MSEDLLLDTFKNFEEHWANQTVFPAKLRFEKQCFLDKI